MGARPTTAGLEQQLWHHHDRAMGYVAAGKLKPALEEYRLIPPRRGYARVGS